MKPLDHQQSGYAAVMLMMMMMIAKGHAEIRLAYSSCHTDRHVESNKCVLTLSNAKLKSKKIGARC